MTKYETLLIKELEELKSTILQICIAQMTGCEDKGKKELWVKLIALANKDGPSDPEKKIIVATRNSKA